jgi:hypothetical protein
MNKEQNSQITTEARNDGNTLLAAGWISIETQMPPLNKNVLVFDDFHRMNICKRMLEYRKYYNRHNTLDAVAI